MEELQELITGVLTTTTAGRQAVTGGAAISGVKKLPLTSSGQFLSYTGAGRSALAQPETGPVELYEFTVGGQGGENESFVLASNDDRVGNILAIGEGSIEDADEAFVEFLNDSLKNYVDTTIAEYNNISEADIEAALQKAVAEQSEGARALVIHWSGANLNSDWQYVRNTSDFSIQKNALLVTKWGQGSKGAYSSGGYAYNNYIKLQANNNDPNRFIYQTGCGPTAIAQIITYHGYISPTAPYKPSAFNDSSMGTWTGTYNLPSLRTAKIMNTSSAAAKGQVAALMYQIGRIAGVKYTDTGTGMDTSKMQSTFKTLGYTAIKYPAPTSITETANSTLIQYGVPLTLIKNSINSNQPLLITGASSKGSGHGWVIDGYGSMTSMREYFSNTKTGQTTFFLITLENCLMVHCNMGQNDGVTNGWYVYGVFDTNNRADLSNEDSSTPSTGGDFSISTEVFIVVKP